MNIAFLVGLVAGLVSALLFVSGWTGTVLGLMVFLFAPLPIAIAGFGWGWASAAIGAVVAALLLVLLGSPSIALLHLLAYGGPASAVSYAVLLNRTQALPESEGHGDVPQGGVTEWYPIGRILFWAAIWAGVLAALAVWVMGGDLVTMRDGMLKSFDQFFARFMASGGKPMTDEQKLAAATMLALLAPAAIAGWWLALAVWNWWLAARIAAQSSRLARPWEDLAAIHLPAKGPLVFAATVLATVFTSGSVMLIAFGFLGALIFALVIVGLGIIHRITRGSSIRGVLLALVYLAIFAGGFLALFVAALGLMEPYLRERLAARAPPAPPLI